MIYAGSVLGWITRYATIGAAVMVLAKDGYWLLSGLVFVLIFLPAFVKDVGDFRKGWRGR